MKLWHTNKNLNKFIVKLSPLKLKSLKHSTVPSLAFFPPLIAKTNKLLRKVHCSFIWFFIEFNILLNMKRVAAKCAIMEKPDCYGARSCLRTQSEIDYLHDSVQFSWDSNYCGYNLFLPPTFESLT